MPDNFCCCYNDENGKAYFHTFSNSVNPIFKFNVNDITFRSMVYMYVYEMIKFVYLRNTATEVSNVAIIAQA